jgi:hypothetical protein
MIFSQPLFRVKLRGELEGARAFDQESQIVVFLDAGSRKAVYE